MTVMGPGGWGPAVDDRPTAAVRPIREAPATPAVPGDVDGACDGDPGGGLVRLALHLTLAALPLLAISAHVFGVLPMHLSAALVVLPLTVATGLLAVFDPLAEERIVLKGAAWGAAATMVYDVFRLDTVYLLGWWGDFIPTMGTWVLGTGEATTAGAVAGYLWRYAGDGPGIGAVFFVLVAATGLRRLGRWPLVGVAVAFAVFPVWTGLVATVGLAPRGQEQMFPLTATTVTLSLVGHLIFGLVLGLGCARIGDLERDWPYPPVLDLSAWAAHLRGGPGARLPAPPSRPAPGLPRRPPGSPSADLGAAGADVVRGGTSRAGGAVAGWGPQTGGHRLLVAPPPHVTELTMPVPPPRLPPASPGGLRAVGPGRAPRGWA